MFEVADLSHVWVQAQIYEDQFASVREGQTVEATVNAYPGEVFRGKVAFIDPVLNPTTRTVNVRYDLPNDDLKLRPGMYATVTLKTPVADSPLFQASDVWRQVFGEINTEGEPDARGAEDLSGHKGEAGLDGRSDLGRSRAKEDLGLLSRLPAQAEGRTGQVPGGSLSACQRRPLRARNGGDRHR